MENEDINTPDAEVNSDYGTDSDTTTNYEGMSEGLSDEEAIARLAKIFERDGDEVSSEEEQTEAPDEQIDDEPEATILIEGIGEVALSEIQNGYLRQSDYTRKTQEISELRKQYAENQRDVAQVRQQALQQLEGMKQQIRLELQFMEQPDMDFLAANDPAEFVRQQHIWAKRTQAVQQLVEQENALKAQQAEYETQAQEEAMRESKATFYAKYPELNDYNKSLEMMTGLAKYLKDTGFSNDEIRSISDYRIIDILYQNIKMQNELAKVPAAVEKLNKKPVLNVKAGGKTSSASRSDYMKEFNKKRDDKSALAALKHIL